MGDFSRQPDDILTGALSNRYVGIHIEQGVPVLDRDLNLLHDLIAAQVRSVFASYIGDGIPTDADGFAIAEIPAPNNFMIGTGTYLVRGIEVTNAGRTDTAGNPQSTTYTDQSSVHLTTPDQERRDLVYLEMFLTEVDGTGDHNLDNDKPDDVGMQTSVRIRCDWKVGVAEGIPIPHSRDGHVFVELAEITRPAGVETIDKTMIKDLRQRRLTVADLEQRMSVLEALRLQPTFLEPAFIPASGIANQPITLNGRNFDVDALSVSIGGTETTPRPLSPTSVTVVVPEGLTPSGKASSVAVSVTSMGGTATAKRRFTVRAVPRFAENGQQIQPAEGAVGASVTLSGFNFNGTGLTVRLGEIAVQPEPNPTNTTITIKVPDTLQVGSTVRATVHTDEGEDQSDDKFKVLPPKPALTVPEFTPDRQKPGQTFKVRGENLNFGSVTATFVATNAVVPVDSPEPNRLFVKVPDGMAPGPTKIAVTTDGGSVTSSSDFTVLP